MNITPPYLLFLGDISDPLSAKTSRGIAAWRPEKCAGQISMPGCEVSLGLPEIDFAQAQEMGVKTFILGLANRGGRISKSWVPYIQQALECGMDIACGLHHKVSDIPEMKNLASRLGRQIFDVRHSSGDIKVGNGRKRNGKRILTVGTDCSVGKMYTALALEKEIKSRDINADFRATGQTGILISGQGISIDAVVADFICGAVESLSPDNSDDHWDIIEGQGSLFHPSFAGVSLGLLHGAQADMIVLCHEVGRSHMRGLPHQPIVEMAECVELNLKAASLTNPKVKLGGISVNSSQLNDQESIEYCQQKSKIFGVPCVDPLRHGMTTVVDHILLT